MYKSGSGRHLYDVGVYEIIMWRGDENIVSLSFSVFLRKSTHSAGFTKQYDIMLYIAILRKRIGLSSAIAI